MKGRKGKSKRVIDGGFQNTITGRINALMDERGWKPADLARKTGIDTGNLSRLSKGTKRAWNLDHLGIIAKAFGLALGAIVTEPIKAPIVGEINQGEGPAYEEIFKLEPLGYHEIFQQEDNIMLAQIYCFRVKDHSLMPAFLPGSIIVAQKETWDTIKNETYVVYCDPQGKTQIRQIFMQEQTIILHSLTQGVPDLVLPKIYLRSCDRILSQKYPPAE